MIEAASTQHRQEEVNAQICAGNKRENWVRRRMTAQGIEQWVSQGRRGQEEHTGLRKLEIICQETEFRIFYAAAALRA